MAYLTKEPINIAQFFSETIDPSCGAQATFLGIVRNQHKGREVVKLFYDCYEPMAEKEIDLIVNATIAKLHVMQARVIHRIGMIQVNEAAVAIAAVSAHRHDAFLTCRIIIDQIKSQVPIWKREFYADGTVDWVTCSEHLSIR